MCPLSLHESISGSVMTKRSGGRVQLSHNLSQPQHQEQCSVPTSNITERSPNTRKVSSLLTSDPVFAHVLSARYRPRVCLQLRFQGAHWLDVLTQVGKLRVRCLLVLFLVLSLHSQSVMCTNWHTEQPKHITFRSKICRTVSPDDLKSRMGKSFDERRMAADGASAKRQFGDTRGYQGDDPYAGYDLEDFDSLDQETLLSSGELWLREEEIYSDDSTYDGISEKKEDSEFDVSVKAEERKGEEEESGKGRGDGDDKNERTYGVRRTWLPRRVRGSRHHKDGRRNYGSSGVNLADDQTNSNAYKPDPYYNYMRRRRRRRSTGQLSPDPRAPRHGPRDSKPKDVFKDNGGSRKDKSSTAKASKKSNGFKLALQLILSGRSNKKLRKQAKKQFRQRARKLNKPPPWQCNFRHVTLFMEYGVFPRVLHDGRCMTDKCFYRLYNCEPIKYAVKLLQRDPDHCIPLPLEGNGTVYEEKWNVIKRHITVGCNCASLADNGRSKSRRKN